MGEFRMPSLGADMEVGKLIEWEKQPGDRVKRGDVIAVVETQKGAIEIEVYEDGILDTCLVELNTPVPVGTILATIKNTNENSGLGSQGDPDSSYAETASEEAKPVDLLSVDSDRPHAGSELIATPEKQVDSVDPARIRITPAARKRAEQQSIDITTLMGSGPGGAIVMADVPSSENARSAAVVDLASTTGLPSMRDAIAASMSRSKREIPHYYLSHRVNLQQAGDYLTEFNTSRTPEKRLLISALYLKAIAVALEKYPEFNGYFAEGRFTQSAIANIGMAINIRGGGLVAPAILDVRSLTLDEVMVKLRDLISRVRAGRYRASELSKPTITLSSLGERGVDSLYGVIYPPQVAIVGIGSPLVQPMVVNEEICSISTVKVTLAADHRVSDGHRGALFLRKIDSLLQQPEAL